MAELTTRKYCLQAMLSYVHVQTRPHASLLVPVQVSGIKGDKEVLLEFMSTFEAQGGGQAGDGVVTFDEFCKYYGCVHPAREGVQYRRNGRIRSYFALCRGSCMGRCMGRLAGYKHSCCDMQCFHFCEKGARLLDPFGHGISMLLGCPWTFCVGCGLSLSDVSVAFHVFCRA